VHRAHNVTQRLSDKNALRRPCLARWRQQPIVVARELAPAGPRSSPENSHLSVSARSDWQALQLLRS